MRIRFATPWRFAESRSLTFGKAQGPASAVLARDDRLALHHVLGIAVELDHVAGAVGRRALGVAIDRGAGVLALNLCKGGREAKECHSGIIKRVLGEQIHSTPRELKDTQIHTDAGRQAGGRVVVVVVGQETRIQTDDDIVQVGESCWAVVGWWWWWWWTAHSLS